MAAETTVGSIVGYLRLNDDDWKASVASAKRDLKELDSQRVNVPVKADADQAKRDLKETAAEADALDAKKIDVKVEAKGTTQALRAIEAVARAENGLRLAEQRTAAARAAYSKASDAGADSERLAALSQKVANARESERLATLRLANVQLSQAATLKKVNDAEEAAAAKSSARTQRARKDVNLLSAAIVALGPAVLPLTVAAVGLGAAFVGMGATAGLAVYGVKKEMQSGSAVGQAYVAQIETLKSDLGQLGATAASGVLAPFRDVVGQISSDMPALNKQVGTMAAITGDVAVPAVHGLLSALQTANPLFAAGGLAAKGMAQKFDTFAQSRGFSNFISYAAANLPQVLDDVEQLAQAAVRLAAAFAPMGMGTLSALRMVAQLLNSLPIGVLQTLATTATGVYLAFQSWKGMSNLLGGVSSAFGSLASKTGSSTAGMIASAAASSGASLAVGGLGLAVGVATIAWGLYQQHQQEVKQTTQDLSSAIQQDTGVIGEHTRAVIASNVAQMDGIDSLSKYGMSQQQVVDAIAQGGPTLDAMISRLQSQKSAADAAAKSGEGWAAVGRDKIDETAGGMSDSFDELRASLEKAQAQQDLYRQALLQGSQASDDAQQANYNLALSHIDVTKATDDQRKAIDQLNQALDREISKQLQVQGGLTGVAMSQADLIKQLQGSAAATDLNSDAGLKNRQAIEQTVGQLQSYRDTLAKSGMSTADATSKYESMGQALLAQIAKTDGASSATYRYAQQLLAVPSEVNTKLGLDDQGALTTIGEIKAALAGIPSSITTQYNVVKNTQNLYSDPKQGRTSGAMWDDGGYTGSGGKYEPAGIVHRGEVVFSQADVDAHGGPAAVEALRKSRVRGYASGGVVGGSTAGYDLSDIFALIQSMAIDPSKLSSAKDAVGSKSKAVGSAQSALSKILIDLDAAERKLRLARATKSKGDDVTAAARVNKLLVERSQAYTKLAQAQQAAAGAQSTYNALLAASKMGAGAMFVSATTQNNAVNQAFLNDLMKIRSRGFGPLALQLLNQGDDEAMKVAHSLASGPLAQLTQASSALQRSGSLQAQLDSLKSSLTGVDVNARRDSNAQLMALQAANNQLRVGSQTIVHSQSVDHDRLAAAIVRAQEGRPIVVQSLLDGRDVTDKVTQHQAENFRRSSTRPWGL